MKRIIFSPARRDALSWPCLNTMCTVASSKNTLDVKTKSKRWPKNRFRLNSPKCFKSFSKGTNRKNFGAISGIRCRGTIENFRTPQTTCKSSWIIVSTSSTGKRVKMRMNTCETRLNLIPSDEPFSEQVSQMKKSDAVLSCTSLLSSSFVCT